MMSNMSIPMLMNDEQRIILGIDPGSRITGFGLIAVVGNKNHYITSGCIRLPDKDVGAKCKMIYQALQELISAHQPTEAAIEQIFMHENAGGALKLGQARGAAITALAMGEVSVAEYTARQVKQAVVGYGAAAKTQVQSMVQLLLQLSGKPQADAADALAIAICHAHFQQGLGTRMKAGRIL